MNKLITALRFGKVISNYLEEFFFLCKVTVIIEALEINPRTNHIIILSAPVCGTFPF